MLRQSLLGWEKEFEEKYESHIINLVTEIRAECGIINNTAKKVGRERLIGIKSMVNSAYTVSSLLRIFHRDYPDVTDEAIKKIQKIGRTTTIREEQLVSAKAHEYHTLTEEMNIAMNIQIVEGNILNQPVDVIVNPWNRNIIPIFNIIF